MPFAALVALVVGEAGFAAGAWVPAAAIDACVVAALVAAASLSRGPLRHVDLALLPLPLGRLVGLLLPAAFEGDLARLGWTVSLAFVMAFFVARAAGYGPREVAGSGPSAWDAGVVVAAAAVAWFLLEGPPALDGPWAAVEGRGGLGLLMLIAAAGIAEEVLFRGLLQNAAVRHWGTGWGVAFAAAAFAVLHVSWAPWPLALGAGVAGLALGGVVARTRSLYGVAGARVLVAVLAWMAGSGA